MPGLCFMACLLQPQGEREWAGHALALTWAPGWTFRAWVGGCWTWVHAAVPLPALICLFLSTSVQVLNWQAGTLKLVNLLLQHGTRLEAFLDDGGILAVCLFVSKFAKHHAADPCPHPIFPALTQAVEVLDWCMCSAASGKRARELFQDGDNVNSGCAVLCGALATAPTQEQLLADLVVRRSLARWTFKRALLRCLETAVSGSAGCWGKAVGGSRKSRPSR